jgi:hypothetical protein
MATIYKRRDLRPIPEGAEIVTYRGRKYAKWTNAKTGDTQRAALNNAGDKIVCESPYYTIKYFDHDGRRVKATTRCGDKDAAQQLANGYEAEAALRKREIIDPTQERFATEARRSLQDHVADFAAYLTAKGNTEKHVQQTGRHIGRVIADCHALQVSDLTGAAVLGVIGKLRASGTSLRTCNS